MTNDSGPDALCSMWQKQPNMSFSMSPGEIQKKLSELQTKLRRRAILLYVICLAEILWFAYWLIVSSLPVIPRIACLLIILSMNFTAGQVWLDDRDRRRATESANALGQANCIDFYRTELVRQHNFHCGVWFWSRLIALVPGLLIFGGWAAIELPGTKDGYAGIGILIAVPALSTLGVWLNYRRSRKHQTLIDAIDAMK
ncbi:MAG TPA: hypothetical protein VMT53_06135 [Terriglobales bacterium]|nr:hypothetical protein [Terriglobales bacterium]